MSTEGRVPSLAERIDQLFRTKHPRGQPEPSYQEVSKAITDMGGPHMSPSLIWQLRKGQKTDPRISQLRGLAMYFEVPIEFFLDRDTEKIKQTYDMMREVEFVRDIIPEEIRTRSIMDSKEAREVITHLLRYVAHNELKRTDKEQDQELS